MKSCNVLARATPAEFRAKAYADYLEDCNKNYLQLIEMVQEAASETDIDDLADENPMTDSEYASTVLSKILTNHSLDSSFAACKVTLSQGYTSVGELLKKVAVNVRHYASVDEADSGSYLTLENIDLTTISTSSDEDIPIQQKASFASVIEDLQNNFHSSVTLQAAFIASVSKDVGERLTVFKDKVQTYFQNTYNDLSNTASYYRSLLSDKVNDCKTLVSTFYDALQLEPIAEGTVKQAENTLAQYTGASPVGVLDFSTARKVVTNTAKVVSATVAAVGTLLFKGVKKIFNWVKRKVTNIFEPFDVYLYNEDGESNSIDGWSLDHHIESFEFDSSPTSLIDAPYWPWINSHKGHWMKYQTLFGEVLWRYNDCGPGNNQQHSRFWSLLLDIDFKFKPYCVDPSVIKEALVSAGYDVRDNVTIGDSQDDSHNLSLPWACNLTDDTIFPGDVTGNTFSRFISFMDDLGNRDYLFDIKDTREKDVFAGFRLGLALLLSVFSISVCEISQSGESDEFSLDDKVESVWCEGIYNSAWPIYSAYYYSNDVDGQASPTNADFIRIASGWDGDTSDPQFALNNAFGLKSGYLNDHPVEFDIIFAHLINILAFQAADRAERPFNYFFVPYQNDVADFLSSKYAIKTDDANQKALTTFLTVAVIVAITVVVAASAAVLIKKLARRRFWKRTEFVGRSDNAMWNGHALSSTERRRYLRYTRKLNAGNTVSAGLQSTQSGLLDSLLGSVSADSASISDDRSFSDIQAVRRMCR